MYGISSKEICNLILILKNGHHFQFLTSLLNLWVLSTYYVSEIIYKDSSYSSWSRKTMAKSQYNYLGDLSYCVYAFILSRIKLHVFIFFSHKSAVGFKKKLNSSSPASICLSIVGQIPEIVFYIYPSLIQFKEICSNC